MSALPVTTKQSSVVFRSIAAPAPRSRFAGKRIHFAGIGGCGMAGLAQVLLDCGAIVSGTDPSLNPRTFALAAAGATISRDQDGTLINEHTDLIVRTAAVKDDNAEIATALRLDRPHKKYAELLGEVMAERFGVGVAGTHGKTTTTGMLAHALIAGSQDPSFVVGATVPQLGGGSRSGMGPHFVAEACEYDRSFLHLRPAVAVVTNIEADHLDCYGTLENIKHAFRAFADLTPAEGGAVIANADDANSRAAFAGRAVTWVGEAADAGWSWTNASVDAGCWKADILHNGEIACGLRLSVPGKHNLHNAVMAIAAAVACGMEPRSAAEHVGTFRGADRRMTHLGRCNIGLNGEGADVVDDYGHHPTEITVTLDALRQRYRPRRLICVFQPHQHSRTRQLLADFARCFGASDEVVLPDVYSVRDDPEDKFVGSGMLADEVRKTGQAARHIGAFDDCETYLRGILQPGDLCVTMGAGNVHVIGERLVSESAKFEVRSAK